MTNPNTQQTIQLSKQDANFEKAFQEAVDEAFTQLGQTSKENIQRHIETAYKIAKTEYPSRIEAFTEAIEQTFGVGAKLIEMNIVKALHEKNRDFLHIPKRSEFIFTDYVTSLQRFLAEKKPNC
jgi:hypothetical protein